MIGGLAGSARRRGRASACPGLAPSCLALALCLWPLAAVAQPLLAAVLPSSRSVVVPTTATAFATIINPGPLRALGCRIAAPTGVPAQFTFQTTDPATNVLIGTPDTPVDIPAGESRSFAIAFEPRFQFGPIEVQLGFSCMNLLPAASISGVNTLLLSASTMPVPDVVALAATVTDDGIAEVDQTAGGVFSVATINVGGGGAITVSTDTGRMALPLDILLCQTNPVTGQCTTGLFTTMSGTMNPNDAFTFAMFLTARSPIAFAPDVNRVFVRFRDRGGFTRGSTSVAVRTVTPAGTQ
jgi:hypothetical protein